MTKDEIIGLLNQGCIEEVFEELDNFFLGINPIYKDLNDEFISRPNNFSLPSFRAKLNRFVTVYFAEMTAKKKPQKKDIDIDDLLHDLDFNPQSTHFKYSYDSKTVSAVLLHGENDIDGNDLKWLCRQLLKTEGLMQSKRICVDFSGSAYYTFEDMLRDLRYQLHLKKDCKRKEIRQKIEDRLIEDSLVILVRNTKKSGNLGEFYKSFNDFFSYLHDECRKNDSENFLIFIFIEDNTEEYKENLNSDYFLWFEEERRARYNLIIKECTEAKIIDLAPVENVQAHLIENWINKNLKYPEIRNAFSCYLGNAECLLEEKSNRYHVIQKLCSELKIEESKQWLNY